MSTKPSARPETRPTRPAYHFEIESALRENDRRELTAILTAAGFRAATFNEIMLPTSVGFAVRSDGPHAEQTGIYRLSVTHVPSCPVGDRPERVAEEVLAWARVILEAGGWDVQYMPGVGGAGIYALRTT